MSEIAIVGNLKEILPFRAAGLKIYPLDELTKEKKMIEIVRDILLKNKHKIVFITEQYYDNFSEFYEAQRIIFKEEMPVITPITNGIDFKNIGIKRLKGLIEKAIGIDIFKE